MNARSALMRSVVFLVGTVVLLIFLHACGFHPAQVPFCKMVEELDFTAASAQPPTLVFEDPGTIKVMHGSGCAHLDKHKFFALKVEQSIEIPAYANNAAVFLNGWKLKYSDGDHHVEEMATAIGKIKFERGKLTWNAVGVLGDEGDPYKAIDWCDWYTVVAWNDTNLHAFVDQGDAEHFCKSGGMPSASDNFFFAENTATSTALSWFRSFLSNANFASGSNVAILPRGFGFRGADHHLLQVAYNLEHSERFIQSWSYKKADGELNPLPAPPTGRVDSGFVSWSTYGIFKDNDTRRDYYFGELVSAMGGPDVRVIEPPFSILPYDGPGWFHACSGAPVGVKTEDVVIDNVPYAYAIPMLTGWELGYGCEGDHHVREVGIWIDKLHYDKAPNASSGTLRYTVSSTLHDDSDNWHGYRHKVTILGLRPLAGGVPVK